MKIVQCIKELKVGETTIFKKDQLIDIDNLFGHNYDNGVLSVNFGNPEYFKDYQCDFSEGDYVLYNIGCGKRIFCQVTGLNVNTKKYHIKQVYGAFEHDVYGINIVRVETYYFISTEGKVHFAHVGQNNLRDNWTLTTNNRFRTKQAAYDYIRSISKAGCSMR